MIKNNEVNRSGQATIFIMIAILVVVGVVVFFVFRGEVGVGGVPTSLQEVYNYYLTCVEGETKNALDIAGSQGGRINVQDYVPGSDFAPFSNQLNFLGFPVPYWYYVSGNGLIKEQVPRKSEIEDEIEEFVESGLQNCNYDEFYVQGFEIESGDPVVSVRIEDTKVNVNVNSVLVVSKDGDSARKTSHSVSVNSKFGKFYGIALEVYKYQKENAFLEDYGVDVLRLYAPVDGVEIQCAPKIWKTQEIVNELKKGLEANIASLKLKGNYYDLQNKKDEYFVVEGVAENSGESVNFIYSPNWPTKVEIVGDGVDNELIIAEPVGTHEGMGVMGFCYVPYHYVYDLSFPVLVQVYNYDEIFQFPVAVIIDNNVPREAVFSESIDYLGEEEFDLCEFKEQDVAISAFDVNLNKVDATVFYGCFSQRCRLGETSDGQFIGKAPACVNGFLLLRSEGYVDKKQLFSTNDESFADVILDREHDVDIGVIVDGQGLGEESAIVSFVREDGKSVTAVLPEVNSVKLSEGPYDINVYIYGESNIVIPSSVKTECRELPRDGLAGIFGGTKEECFDIVIPETRIEHGLVGGGKGSDYFLENDLQKGSVNLRVKSLPRPRTLEQLQYNFESFESAGVNAVFK